MSISITGHAQSSTRKPVEDSLLAEKKQIQDIIKIFKGLKFTGLIHTQWQLAQTAGEESFDGGNFSQYSNNRFMLRRARIGVNYLKTNTKNIPIAQFVAQVDITPAGVVPKDVVIQLFDPKWQLLSLSVGAQKIPFGYEVTQSTAVMLSPERGRMSQLLIPSEREIGAILSIEPKLSKKFIRHFKLDIGLFNGQPLSVATDFDKFKDMMIRLRLKPVHLTKKLTLSSGLSWMNGLLLQTSPTRYKIEDMGATKGFVALSNSYANQGTPRRYYGFDIQLAQKTKVGSIDLRGEYWQGTQSATQASTQTPSAVLTTPAYLRQFNGIFVYAAANIFNPKNQLVAKLDIYNPNKLINDKTIGINNTLTAADIKYTTLGLGYNYYLNNNIRLLAYYEWVYNAKTNLNLYTADIKDNLLTLRLQYIF